MVKIAIIGAGQVGFTLGKTLATKGKHTIIYASRDPTADKIKHVVAQTPNSSAETIEKAVKDADVIFLTLPWEAVESTAKQLGEIGLDNKVLVDVSNPIAVTNQGLGPALPNTTSGAEEVAKWVKGTARVVKAFNTINIEVMANPDFNGVKSDLFIAGDDAEAKQVVAKFGKELEFETVDVGPLYAARRTEDQALFFVSTSFGPLKWGPKWVLKIHRRD